jgi:MFS family permease
MDINSKLPKEFWHFVSAKLFYTLGLRMISTIVIYQVFHLASTYMVGIAGLTEFLPAVATALYAGHYIDTHNKKNILVSTYGLYILCVASLAIVSLPQLNFPASTKITVILCAVFSTGIIRSFAQPAANAMIAAIVSREQLQKAISLNSSTYLSSSIAGHASGGLVIAFLGISNAYFAAAVLLFIAGIFALRLKPKPPYLTERKEPTIQAIKHGFSFVWNNKTLLGVISLDLFAVLFGGAVAFIPEIAEKVLPVQLVMAF